MPALRLLCRLPFLAAVLTLVCVAMYASDGALKLKLPGDVKAQAAVVARARARAAASTSSSSRPPGDATAEPVTVKKEGGKAKAENVD